VGFFTSAVELQLAYGHVGGAFASYLEYDMTTLKDFQSYVQALKYHDWNYEFSDDHSVWKAGRANEKKLRAQASTDTLLMHTFACWADFMSRSQGLKERTQRDAYIASIAEKVTHLEKEAA